MKLSILVTTMPGRESVLSRLLWGLSYQLTPDVEVLVYGGIKPLGDKVNEMWQVAKGEFSVVVDDDDWLASDYVEQVLAHTKLDVDYIPYILVSIQNGVFDCEVRSCMAGDVGWTKQPFGVLVKCPVRTSISKEFTFPNHHSGDNEWAKRVHLSGKIKKESPIEKPMYFYDFWKTYSLGTEAKGKKRFKGRKVGIYPYDKEKFIWLS